jgi:epoxyqueuosine reductase
LATSSNAGLTPERRSAQVKQQALDLGFHAAGVADLSPVPHENALTEWLQQGMAGEMAYMSRQADRRRHPATIVPGATRAIVLTRHYDHHEPENPGPGHGHVAKYARGIDYHDALRGPLATLSSYVVSLGDHRTIARPYVDAGPVPERELAQRAGLGWIGKNTMLIDARRGSYSFIATVFTNLDLAIDLPFSADRCGTCRRCMDACPTGAIVQERVVDARRCISYVTIEQRDDVDPDLAALVGNWVFGCDICQDVCPWNVRFATDVSGVTASDPQLAYLDLAGLISTDDASLDRRFRTTALMRAGPRGLRRSAAIVRSNLGDARGLSDDR